MAQRRYGPTLDAGTVIIEEESQKTITPSALGSTAYPGILERGPVGELIPCTGKSDLAKKTGGYIPDSLLPDVARDFWSHGNGAGTLLLVRVTDGSEVAAWLDLYDRKNPRNKVIKVQAKNGGGWGGRKQTWVVDITTLATDVNETSIDLPIPFTLLKDQLKGGRLTLSGANGGAGATYDIISNDKSDGATVTTVNLAADSTAKTDLGVSVDQECVIAVPSLDGYGQEKHLAVEVRDGQVNPSTHWGLFVYLNGGLVYKKEDLSSDPASRDYFVEVVNNDEANQYVTLTDLWVGSVTASMRPANHWGNIASSEVAEKLLTIDDTVLLVDSSLAGDATIAAFTLGGSLLPDTYEIEYVGPDWTVKSLGQQVQHAFPDASDGVPYVADNVYSLGFTITEGTPGAGEKFTITVLPLVEDQAIDGKIFFPGVAGAPAGGWNISDNAENTVSLAVGDLTLGASLPGTLDYRLEFKQQLGFGYDGIAEVDENDFLPIYDTGASPFEQLLYKGYGLVKFATPGVTSLLSSGQATTVEKAGIAYADARNYQYREEIPSNITSEHSAKAHVQDTLGKSTYAKVVFPGWAYVGDPIKSGLLKLVPTTGMAHGREALVAKNYNGYHKVAAGIEVKLPNVKKLPTDPTVLNGEVLNPAGLQRIDKRGGNYVIWGARIPYTDPAFQFCQHREMLSHYEHVLQENFDYIIFAINDSAEWPGLIANLKSFFLPEWRKRALRGDSFEEAASIKLDAEINDNATMAAGDTYCEIKLRLADTIERFIITVSKAGIFESLAA